MHDPARMPSRAVHTVAMRPLPTGTLTLLFSDIEGSTALLHGLGPRWGEALSAQRRILRTAFGEHDGHEMGTEGDSFFVVFASAHEALHAARLRHAAVHPGRLAAGTVLHEHGARLRQVGASRFGLLGPHQEAQAVAMHQPSQHVGRVAHRIEQGGKHLGVQRRCDHAREGARRVRDGTGQVDGPHPQIGAKRGADHQIARGQGRARRLEVGALGEVPAHQFGAAGGPRGALGVNPHQGAHAGHGIAERRQALMQPHGIHLGEALQVARQRGQDMVHRV